MAVGGYLGGGGTANDPMVVGDYDENVQATDTQDKDSENTQENQVRPVGTQAIFTGVQDGSSNDRHVRPTSGTPALASNDPCATCSRPSATPAPSPIAPPSKSQVVTTPSTSTMTAASNTPTASTSGPFVGGHVSIGIITAPTNTNTPTAADAGTQCSVSFVAGIPPAGPYPAGPVNQRTRHAGEWFYLHPTDPMKLVAVFKIENPYAKGTYYEQRDEIPVFDPTAKSPDRPSFIYSPDLKDAKIPPKNRANKKNNQTPNLWVRRPESMEWTRPGLHKPVDRWSPIVVFRRFNSVTKKYENLHISLEKLKNVDPNNERRYHHRYNKWVDQIKRRKDMTYVKTSSKNHWSVAERRELCRALNDFVHKWGLHMFGFKDVHMTKDQMVDVADTINAVGGMGRRHDAVRSQIFSSHAEKNEAVFDLLQRADAVRERLANGEVIPRDQLHPEEAIPESEFPEESVKDKAVAKKNTAKTKKSKDTNSTATTKKRSAAVLEEEEDDDLSAPPANLDEPVQPPSTRRLPWLTRSSIGPPPKKKIHHNDPASNELPIHSGSSAATDDSNAQCSPDTDEDSRHSSDDTQWESTDDDKFDPKKVAKHKAAHDMQRGIINSSYKRGGLTVAEATALENEDEAASLARDAAAPENEDKTDGVTRATKRKRKSGKGGDDEVSEPRGKKAKKDVR